MNRVLLATLLFLPVATHAETINCETVREDKVKVQLEIVNNESASISFFDPTYGRVARQGFQRHLLRETQGSRVFYVTDTKPHERLLSFPNGTAGYQAKGILLKEKLEMACTIEGELADEIEKPKPIACSNRDYSKVLFEGIAYGRTRDVQEALSCGADANLKEKNGCTALLYATDMHCGTFLPQKILGDSNGRWIQGAQTPGIKNPISPALSETLELLVSKGADVNVRDPKNGENTLIKLVRNSGDSDLIAAFLENGPEFNSQDLEGNSALMWATTLSTINSDAFGVMQELVGNSADRSLKNTSGLTAFDIAQGIGLDEKNRGIGHDYDKRILRLLKPATKIVKIVGRDGECSPLEIMINRGESVEFILEATEEMYLMTAPGLGINLMAMEGEPVRQVITATKSGHYDFTCGFHGAEKQSNGMIMVH